MARVDGTVIAGNHTLEAARSLGWTEIAVVRVDDDDVTATAYALADNRTADLGGYDETALADLIAEITSDADLLVASGYSDVEVADLISRIDAETTPLDEAPVVDPTTDPPKLADRFIIGPFTLLDARSGHWNARKRRWMTLGLRSVGGRDESMIVEPLSGRVPDYYRQKREAERRLRRPLSIAEFESDHLRIPDCGGMSTYGTSLFDPVLAEITLRWFCPPDGKVIDPFAGGPTRGVVAALLGRSYLGVDLRSEQTEFNQREWTRIRDTVTDSTPYPTPTWITGDAVDLNDHLQPDQTFDLLFTCPPYGDLEVYSDDPRDLSTMTYEGFLDAYRTILTTSMSRLRDDRFAVIVVGEIRDRRGINRGFVGDTIDALSDAGGSYYNRAVLATPIAAMAMKAERPFLTTRKLASVHQDVLVFVKGDAKRATSACGAVTTEMPEITPGVVDRYGRTAPTKDRAWTAAVRERDNYRCQRCGVHDPLVHAHHVQSRARRPDLRHDVSNGKSLCGSCHQWVHHHPAEAELAGWLSNAQYEADRLTVRKRRAAAASASVVRVEVDEDRVVELYTAGRGMKAVGEAVGVSLAVVNRVLRERGVTKRQPGRPAPLTVSSPTSLEPRS